MSAYLERTAGSRVYPPPFFRKLLANGAAVEARKLERVPAGAFREGERVLLCDEGGLFAAARVIVHDGALCVKTEMLL